jgi:hypothetical protein
MNSQDLRSSRRSVTTSDDVSSSAVITALGQRGEEPPMASVLYLHWDKDEAQAAAKALRAAEHSVRLHWSTEDHAKVPETTEACVTSLDRLPSHARAVAEWFWEAKKRQIKPLVFVGGEADKVGATRRKFPIAAYCAPEALPATLAKLLPE